MKTKLTILFTVLGSAFATTVVFGQTTYVWTNQFPGHLAGVGDMNQATNWSPNGVPNPMTGPDANGVCGDLMQFAGLTTGPLSVTESGGTLGGGGGQNYPAGARIELTSAQTNSVTIYSVISISGGLRMNWFTIDPGAGPLILGDHSANNLDILAGEQNGQVLGFTNNSSTPCVINETVVWREGGAGNHPFVFAGTGDWIVNNHLRSHGSSAIQPMMEGSGTFTWTGTNSGSEGSYWYDRLGNPVRFDSGTTILKSSDLLNADAGSPNIVNNGTLLKFDYTPAPGIITTPGTIAGNISGTGPFQINNGIVTFAGASTFTGNINLTGGELIAGSTENVGVSGPLGQGGTISFNGGTLGFGTNNVFDYSPRFSTADGQAYSIDTGGQNVTFAAGLTSSGGTFTKLGGGALTLSGASSYDGITTVSAGKLVFQGVKIGTGNITVADGATLGVTATGAQITPGTLTLGTNTGCTLEFNNVTNTATAPLAAGTLSSTGTVTININSGAFTIGQSYPLLTWTSGSAPTVSLGSVVGTLGNLSTNGNTIQFNVATVTLIWSGANNGNWDTTTLNNWTEEGSPTNYFNPAWVRFDDTASGTTTVIVSSVVQPTSVTISNSNKSYNITSGGSNSIADSAGLTKSGNGALTLSGGGNTYTGVTTVSGGTLSVGTLASGGLASDIGAAASAATNLVLNGGMLQYTGGGTSIDRLFALGTNGGAIDASGSGALNLTNSGLVVVSDRGTRTLALTGTNTDTNTLAGTLSDSFIGATSLTKSGPGTWVLTATNTYSGGTTISSGVLQVGNGGGTGSLGTGNITNNGALDFNGTNTLTVSGAISGAGSVTNDGTGTVILLSNGNTYSGNTTINSGTLQISGTLNGNILNNGTLLGYNATVGGVISGPGQVTVSVGGFLQLLTDNTYTGGTTIGALSILHVGNGGA
ncbi:MAG TPA: autotransporter-associated beta strand repeat-containing protein, partial [Verrucomicrobiae bacterium]|nr:autotransporter-associated beta strand repeat-containing protein [Verrucomicrobiae bacterium]